MPYYDFYCKECKVLHEDEFFKIADEKIVECVECRGQMEQVILKAPGLSDPGGIGQKWTNEGYQLVCEKSGNLRNVTEKWEKGKNVIRSDPHSPEPIEKLPGLKPWYRKDGTIMGASFDIAKHQWQQSVKNSKTIK